MKLVELLARELSEWPEKASHAVQHEDGDVGFTYDGKPGRDKDHSEWSINALTASEKAYWLIGVAKSISTIASDHASAIVTRTDWEAERARIAKPAKNAEGWIRHRGGKCPVDAGTVIEYRERNGNIEVECEPELLGTMWLHENHPHDIMAYRLHKPVEQVEACSKPDPRDSAKRDSDYVCWMRDRITEIDATTQALTTERAELVQKLASEGFALIGRINELLTDSAQKHEDMSDWRNWREGDLLEVTGAGSHKFPIGVVVRLKRGFESDGKCGVCEYIDGSDYWYLSDSHVKFHSRPSA